MILVGQTDLATRTADGDVSACARLMTWAERGDARYAELACGFADRLGSAVRIGVTGPPGAGKSTLVDGLVRAWRGADRSVGVVAVDPSSPFTGGALLGDRVRMADLTLDPGVFIRSMATRGEFGGLARATDDVADVLDLAGYDVVLLETVGVGQSEVDVARSCDVTLVVLHPGAGDTIQAMKAGLLEAADLYVVNKDDLPGGDALVAQLEEALELRGEGGSRATRPPILRASAAGGEGVVELADQLLATVEGSRADGSLQRRRDQNLSRRVRRLVEGRLLQRAWVDQGLAERLDLAMADGVTLSAHALARTLLDDQGDDEASLLP